MSRAWYKVLGREPNEDELEAAWSYINAFPPKSSDDGGSAAGVVKFLPNTDRLE